MEKYRIVIIPIVKSENNPVILFRMKSGATDSSEINSWEIVDEYADLPTCFKMQHLPYVFKTVGHVFNPVTLQNF